MLIKAVLLFFMLCVFLKFFVYDVITKTSTEQKIWLLKKTAIAIAVMSVACVLIGVVVILF